MESQPRKLVRTKPRRRLVNAKVAGERSFAERHRAEIVAGGVARQAIAEVMDDPERRIQEVLDSEVKNA